MRSGWAQGIVYGIKCAKRARYALFVYLALGLPCAVLGDFPKPVGLQGDQGVAELPSAKVVNLNGAEVPFAFSLDGKRIAGILRDREAGDRIIVLDIQSGKRLMTGQAIKEPSISSLALAFHPNGRMIASGGTHYGKVGEPGEIIFWDAETGRKLKTLIGHKSGVREIAFSPDGKLLASSDGSRVLVWNVETGKQLRVLVKGAGCGRGLAFRPDSNAVCALPPCYHDANMLQKGFVFGEWDVNTGKKIYSVPFEVDETWSIAYSPNGRFIAASYFSELTPQGYGVLIWEVKAGRLRHTLTGFSDLVPLVSFSSDSRYLAACAGYDAVKIWDVNTGKVRWKLPPKTKSECWEARFSSDETLVCRERKKSSYGLGSIAA